MNKRSKKLVIFIPFIGGGGVEKNLFIISNYLSKKLSKVNICTTSIKEKNNFNKKINFLTPTRKIPENMNLKLRYLFSLYTLFKFLSKNKDSVVFSFQANIYCIILCKLLNIRIIIRSNASPKGWYKNSFKKLIYKFFYCLADTIIVNSLDFKKEMDFLFGKKTNCILNPLNLKEIQKKSLKGKKEPFFQSSNKCLKLLNVGRLTEQKDQITLLKAVNLLKNRINFKLLIVGRGMEKNKLKEFIKTNKLHKCVKIINFTKNPFGYFKQSDLFVLTSRFEGLPNVLLEAAALKKFIISTNCPTGPREILLNNKGGEIVKVGNYKELATKILYYKKNKKKLKKKIDYLYNRLYRYDFDQNLNKYFLLIRKFVFE